jgi:molybdopterin-guanine dinucleotide biosynthesis protein A
MSSRLGFPKALLRFGDGRTLIQNTVAKLRRLSDDVFVVANEDLFAVAGCRREPDRFQGAASLGGIYTAIAAARYQRVLVVGCDMPLLDVALLAELVQMDGDAVVPRIEGFPEPLHALYSKACLRPIETRIRAGNLKIRAFFADVRVTYLDLEPGHPSFRNVNTPELVREAYWQPRRESNPRRHP